MMRIAKEVSMLCMSGLIALGAMTGVAMADEKINVGMLHCDVSAGVGLFFTEKQTMNCMFKHLDGSKEEHYKGTIQEVGIAIGGTEKGVLIWSVISAQKGVPAGALAGKYTGLGVNASVGVGGGENVLMGGNNKAFMLQPSSYEGQVGLNLAVGVTTITLVAAH
jgi:hypothetical protein